MKSLQDKICDGLTLVGLLAVIGFGSASLLPESQPEEEAEPAATTDSIAAPVDTLRDVTPVYTPEVREEVPADTVEADTLSEHVATEILDSLSAAPVEHPDEQHAKAVEHSNHKQAENVSVETKSKEQHKAKEPHKADNPDDLFE